jgi:hypothetical protein
VESLGEWRFSGVLLHKPFGEMGHPGIIGPAVEMSAEGCFAVKFHASRFVREASGS